MILPVLLLLAAAPERTVLVDEIVSVPAKGWRDIGISLRQRPAAVDCRYQVTSGGSGIRAMLLKRTDVARLREGLPHWPIAGTRFLRAGAFRAAPGTPGDYSLVLDNSLDARDPATVHLTVSLLFTGAGATAAELSPRRRLIIVLLSLLFLVLVGSFVAWRLRRSLLDQPPPPPPL